MTALHSQNQSALILVLLACLPVAVLSQAPTHGRDPSDSSPNAGSMSQQGMSPAYGRPDPVEEARRQQLQRVAIREAVQSDTARLLELAKELDDEIDRTSPDALTPAQLKKVAEIGKLAHRLKSEMKQTGTSSIEPMPAPIPLPVQNEGRRDHGTN